MIGIDKTTINNIKIVSVDFDKLMTNNNVTVSRDGITASLPTNIPGQYKEVHEIRIKDGTAFNTFRFAINTTGGKFIPYCLMEIHIRSLCGDNMNPLNIEAYKRMLQQIRIYVADRYGIRLNFDNIGFKEIEINCTFELDREFKEYEYLLDRIYEVAPKRYKDKAKFHDNIDNSLKEIVFYNQSTELKVYDKKKQLKDVYKIKIDKNLMRIEYTFMRPQKVEDALGTSKVNELTDESIQDYIKKGIEKDIIKPLLKHVEKANKQLLKIAKEYKQKYPKQWAKRFIDKAPGFYMVNEIEVDGEIKEEKIMLLVDNQQLKDIVYKVASNKRTAKNLYKEIECIKQSDGSLNKLQYIQQNIL